MFSELNPSKCTHTWSSGQPMLRCPGVRCLDQVSHLSRGQFLPELRFEPTTSGYKSDARSIRPRLPPRKVLLDLSAAFDTIDHDILIDRLQNYTGVQGQALSVTTRMEGSKRKRIVNTVFNKGAKNKAVCRA